jgi:putative FmdB family regulatory protein
MPVYEYRCKSCGKTHEIAQGFNDERPTKCPECGGSLARVFHPIGVVFKGSGFHKTDYGGTARKPAASGDPAGVTDGKSAETAAPSGASESKPPETKPKVTEGKAAEPKSSTSKPDPSAPK